MFEVKITQNRWRAQVFKIVDDNHNYLHSDGLVYNCGEYWPTRKQAQAVLDKHRPKPKPLNPQLTEQEIREMKSGDRVTIRDYSYVRSIANGKLTDARPNYPEDGRREYTVVETGCSFPLVNQDTICAQPHYDRNDTVIQGDDGLVIMIHNKFLTLVDPSHVWKHGDVFRRNSGTVMIYVVVDSGPLVYCLYTPERNRPRYHPIGPGVVNACLKDATFLFNIKDHLDV